MHYILSHLQISALKSLFFLQMSFMNEKSASTSDERTHVNRWRAENDKPYVISYNIPMYSPTVTRYLKVGSWTGPSIWIRSYFGVICCLLSQSSCKTDTGVLVGWDPARAAAAWGGYINEIFQFLHVTIRFSKWRIAYCSKCQFSKVVKIGKNPAVDKMR